ncbi:hypothetical protein B0H16DRAFT_1892349 [Mycena metata]|uniref:DUF6535 domain-containing protein n=1 Tax=Mycena metata TaxID=1033252 RepID=A0AAD7I4U8_9AGAR|nr:hypothetical protein B0H16DRAFT_1892349 [Mycena metata]
MAAVIGRAGSLSSISTLAQRMSTAANPAALSDSDRLITALQTCFIDLAKKQEEQGEKLYRAVEALKPQVPTTDKKTAFWTSYMKLADEHDKEFQQKHSTDLDTALIFSGLFSAVASAFVIQIEPQLAVNPPKIIVIVQLLLYASLFTTLLAALLAVLGKQWLMYYQAAGSRGTLEDRGLERQRKLDGLVKWKFEAVLRAFPLLLQLSLLLFASAISVYLWTVHHSVAILVTALTALGLGLYISLLVSATLFSDCPFQSPLAPILENFLHNFFKLRPAFQLPYRTRRSLRALSRFGRSQLELLPRFMSRRILPSNKPNLYAEYKSVRPSLEVPAVSWALAASTDPAMIGVAAELGADLQWPIKLDRFTETTLCRRLWTTAFMFSSSTVRPGMPNLTAVCGKLYCLLDRHAQRRPRVGITFNSEGSIATGEPAAILHVRLFGEEVKVELPVDSAATVRWMLQIIPSLAAPSTDKMWYLARKFPIEAQVDMQIFTNFLCCVGAVAIPAEWLIRRVDKTVEGWLTAAKVARTSLTELLDMHWGVRLETGHLNPRLARFGFREEHWIYTALEHAQKPLQEGFDDAEDSVWDSSTTRAIDGLLQVLSCNDSFPDNPPIPSLVVILRALSSTTDVAVAAFLVLIKANLWFLNPNLQPFMRDFSVWHHLSRIVQRSKEEPRLWDVIAKSYQHIVQQVAHRPEWKSALFEELPTCIAVFSDSSGPRRWLRGEEELKGQRSDFISVLQNIWVPRQQQRIQFIDAGQQCTALCLVSLSNVWESYDMSKSSVEQFLLLAHCTVTTALLKDDLPGTLLHDRDTATLRDELETEIKAWEESLRQGEEVWTAASTAHWAKVSAAQVEQRDTGEEGEGDHIAVAVN